MDGRQIYSLSDILKSLENSVRREFPYSFWLKADISKLNLYQYSGHAYPELVEKQNGVIVAQTRAIIWKSDFNRINTKFLNIVKEPLKDGISIVCSAKLTFHSLYGLSLIISDIDPSMTLGQLEQEKLLCIERLKQENIFSNNSKKILPLLPQRLAVISVITSKGYSDFIQTLEKRKDEYKFFIHLFPSLLQGDNAGVQLIEALNTIKGVKEFFDCVMIIRGGGGDIGLTCYNDYQLCREIANYPLPVLTGIGHSTNETVAESVSWHNFITPTALAEFVLNKFDNYCNNINIAKQKITKQSEILLKQEYKNLGYLKHNLISSSLNSIQKQKDILSSSQKYLNAIHPANLLKKGFTITRQNGKIVTSVSQIRQGQEITTQTFDGEFTSTIK